MPPPNQAFTAVAVGNYHTMGLKPDGSIVAWGLCDIEQCQVPAPNSGFLKIVAGDSHSMGLRPGGVLAVWGSNEQGQGVEPTPNSGFVTMAAGAMHSLAIRADGSIACWGHSAGECAIPEPNGGWVAVAGGGWFSMGMRADGSIHRWGNCIGGPQCPGPPGENTGFVAMATSHNHSLGLKANGSIVAWGENGSGQLNVPEPNSGFTAIAAGGGFSLALRSDGSIACFGNPTWCGVPQPNTGYVAVAANTSYWPHALRAEAPCQLNEQCDDGVFCNGAEACNAGTCVPGPPPCSAPLFCRESDDSCVQCLNSASCNEGLFCNGVETAAPPDLPRRHRAARASAATNADACVGAPGGLSLPVNRVPVVGRRRAGHRGAKLVSGAGRGLRRKEVGLGARHRGMDRMEDGSILLSFSSAASIAGMTEAEGSSWKTRTSCGRPKSLGTTTRIVRLLRRRQRSGDDNDTKNIDASATSAGQLLISTVGKRSANGAGGADSDLLRFNATRLGSVTSGSFVLHFDGSDVGLTDNGNEDLDAASGGPNGTLLLSTTGSFSVSGASRGDEDIVQFTPATLGTSTSGSFGIFLDLSALGISTAADVGSAEFVP